MDLLHDDAAARREGLERWADEQRRSHQRPAPVRLRTSLMAPLIQPGRLARGVQFADRVLDRIADRVFDRGLDTSGYSFLPEHRDPDLQHYEPSAWHVLPRALRYLGGVSDRD